jgi:hypothetical protein
MNFDLPDETSSLWHYVNPLDRHVIKLCHNASSCHLIVGVV